MERVYHVNVIEVGRSRLIGNVDRMLERKVPHREGLKLGISCPDATLVLIIQLTQTHCHLAAARTGSSDDDERTLGLHIVVLAEAFVRSYQFHVVRIALNEIVAIGPDAKTFQTLLESHGCRLSAPVGDDHRTYHEATALEFASEPEHILVVGDTEVGPFLVLLNVCSTDYYDNLYAVVDFLEHTQLAVWQKTRQHTTGMMVIEELSSKLQIQFSIKLGYSLLYVFRLYRLILIIVKPYLHR